MAAATGDAEHPQLTLRLAAPCSVLDSMLDSEALHRPRAPPRQRPWRPGPAPARAGQEYSHQVSGRSGALRPSLRARLRFRGGSGWVTRAGCVA